MKKSSANKGKKPKSTRLSMQGEPFYTIKNLPILFLFLILVLLLIYSFTFLFSPKLEEVSNEVEKLCEENQTRNCTLGSCVGTSTCTNDMWSPCRWEKICIPGSRAMCIENSCAKGVKECNECGTGYGPCTLP